MVYQASLGPGVIIQHQAMVDGVSIPAGMHVPSMTGGLSEKDVRKLRPASPEWSAFAETVRRMNVFLSEVC